MAPVSLIARTLFPVMPADTSGWSTWKVPPPAAADIGPGHLDKLQTGDLLQQTTRFLPDPLAAREVAGIMVGRLSRKWLQHPLQVELVQILGNVHDLLAQGLGRIGILPPLFEDMNIFIFQRAPASGAIDENGIDILTVEKLQVLADVPQGGLPGAGQKNGQTAAHLPLGQDHLDIQPLQYRQRRPSDILVKVIGGAAGEVQDAPFWRGNRDDLGNLLAKGLLVQPGELGKGNRPHLHPAGRQPHQKIAH